MNSYFFIFIVVIAVVCLISVFLTFVPLGLWVSSLAANVKVSILNSNSTYKINKGWYGIKC